jgi:minor curlin subunit
MWKLIASVLLTLLLLGPSAAIAQTGPDTDAVPDVLPDAQRQQVVSAITGQLPAEQGAAAAGNVLFELDFSGTFAGIVARALTSGTGNTAAIFQDGANNTAQVEQIGQNNAAVMVQRGSFNTSTLLQDGNYNVYGSLLDGMNNTLRVEQIGDNNGYIFGFQGNNLNHAVQQIGNNIKATQIGMGHAPFSIEQHGSNMDITIRHNGAQ